MHHESTDAGDSPVGTTATNPGQPQVIPSQGDPLGDLLNLDLGPPVNVPQVSSMQIPPSSQDEALSRYSASGEVPR